MSPEIRAPKLVLLYIWVFYCYGVIISNVAKDIESKTLVTFFRGLEILIIFEILSYAADQINNHSTDFGNEYFFDEICTFGKFHVFDAPIV